MGQPVPANKIFSRYPRTLGNLRAAIKRFPHVVVYDNSDLSRPFRQLADFENGEPLVPVKRPPKWFQSVTSKSLDG